MASPSQHELHRALHFESALLPDGWAAGVRFHVDDEGRIARVERGVASDSEDERGFVALPGLPNVHSHAFQRAMAGLSEQRCTGHQDLCGSAADNFWSWRSQMYRFANVMTPEDLEAVAAQAYMEMLESAFTRVCEFHYLHHDTTGRPYADPAEMSARIVSAAGQTGIGLTLLPVFYAHSGFGGRPPSASQRRFVNTTDRFGLLLDACKRAASVLPDAVVGIAPHSLRAVTPAELASVLPMAANAPVHVHAAETLREVDECLESVGARPVEWLLDNVDVNELWCIVHATHTTENELARLARSGAVAGLCPITEANLGDGVFPARRFQEEGGRWGIGSDSNVLIDAAEELRLLEYGQRLRDHGRNRLALGTPVSTGRALIDGALAGTTTALGTAPSQKPAGLLEGASADIVSLSRASVAFAARTGDQLLDSFVFARCKDGIDGVWCAGRKVVAGGRHIERESIQQRYTSTMRRLIIA